MGKPIIIIGAKKLGKSALEIFNSNEIISYGFLDDDESVQNMEIGGLLVLGKTEDDEYLKLIGDKCGAFIATDDTRERKSLVKMLKDRCKEMPANAIHKNAIIPESVHLGFGNFINAGVIIGSGSKLGNHCILHTGSIIDQDCQVSDYVQIGAAAVINQNVIIEDEVFIGSGAIIVSEIKIGKGARIGAGSIVIENIKPGATVFGNPAKSID
jgi:sugar O-acyltransferase (sialic acid O-acetyltransferase NeuD family)